MDGVGARTIIPRGVLRYPTGGYRHGLEARDIILDMNAGFPIRYVDPVFRPPSEAESLILPVTDGCSWNQCTFCEMYTAPQKKFRARDAAETLETLRRCGERFGDGIRRVFLLSLIHI